MSAQAVNVWSVTVWSPGLRKSQLALETPYEGVPKHLQQPLWSWVEEILSDRSDLIAAAGLELRLTLPSLRENRGTYNAMRHLQSLSNDQAFLLTLVEYVVENVDDRHSNANSRRLEAILALANSAYKVREDPVGLEMRTTPEVQAQVQEVVHTSAAAGVHLAKAWNAAYSLSPDPVKSYNESVKAVETALIDKISPNKANATLGSMIADLKNKPEKWKFAIPDGRHSQGVETVLGMMQVLWQGNARHGGPNHQPETPEAAQAAVHLAATLVQFGVSGAFDLA